MKVVSLLGSDFVESCRLLAQKISKDYNPDLVIGVLTGGGYVGKEIFHFLPHSEKQLYIETKIQRVNTKTKEKGIIKRILKYSPTFLLDWMRMLEAIVLEQKAKRENNLKREGVISFPSNVDSFLKSEFKKSFINRRCNRFRCNSTFAKRIFRRSLCKCNSEGCSYYCYNS